MHDQADDQDAPATIPQMLTASPAPAWGRWVFALSLPAAVVLVALNRSWQSVFVALLWLLAWGVEVFAPPRVVSGDGIHLRRHRLGLGRRLSWDKVYGVLEPVPHQRWVMLIMTSRATTTLWGIPVAESVTVAAIGHKPLRSVY
jgi:hypothetical protein